MDVSAFEQKDIWIELSRWGLNSSNATYTPNQCEELHHLLVTNYPCMKEGMCGPYNDTSIMVGMIVFLLLAVWLGYWLRGYIGKTSG